MFIEDYGFHLHLFFNNEKKESIPISSWDDFPDIILKSLKYAKITHYNGGLIWSWNRDYGVSACTKLKSNDFICMYFKDGWTIKYFVKKTAKEIFKLDYSKKS
jgi:hypothetical protein